MFNSCLFLVFIFILVNQDSTTGSNFIIQKFQILLHENLIRCKISIGNRKDAITDIGKCVEICKKDSRLFQTHSVQLNVLLGLYAMSLNQYDTAELQLKHALKVNFLYFAFIPNCITAWFKLRFRPKIR